MSSNYARYLYRRWNADRQIRGAVLWREYMAQYGVDTPITINVVRRLLREFRNENFSSVPSQVDLPVSSADDHQLPETDDFIHPPKKPHLDGVSAADDDHHHYNSEEMEVEDMDIFEKTEKEKVDRDKKNDDKKEEEEECIDDEMEKEESDDEDEDEDEDDEDEDEDENEDAHKGEDENDDNERGDKEYDEEYGSVEKRIEKENNGDEDDLYGEEDDDNTDRMSEENFHLGAQNDEPNARQSLVAALPAETKRAFVLYQYMSKCCFFWYTQIANRVYFRESFSKRGLVLSSERFRRG